MDFMSVPTKAILMYKAPQRGCVKTRLGNSIGTLNALKLYRWMGLRQLSVIPTDWNVEALYSPEGTENLMRGWLGPRPVLILIKGLEI